MADSVVVKVSLLLLFLDSWTRLRSSGSSSLFGVGILLGISLFYRCDVFGPSDRYQVIEILVEISWASAVISVCIQYAIVGGASVSNVVLSLLCQCVCPCAFTARIFICELKKSLFYTKNVYSVSLLMVVIMDKSKWI